MIYTDYLIIGGGITGLSMASFLEPLDYVLIEKENEFGGYCRTIKQGDFIWDYSGHFFHFKNEEIKNYLSEFLDEKPVELRKKSSIYYSTKFIDFPFQDNIHQLDTKEFLQCLVGMISKSKHNPKNFKDFVNKNLGGGISQKFIIPYNEKLYSCNLDKLDVDCMGRFFPKPLNLFEYLKKVIFKKNTTSYNDSFIYPKNGAYDFIKSLLKRVRSEKLNLQTELLEIDLDKKIATTNTGKIKFKNLINTSPFSTFSKFFSTESNSLTHNKVLVFNLGFDRKTQIKDNWIYFPGNELFYRVGFYNNLFDSDKMSLYVEIGLSSDTDENLYPSINDVIYELKKVGIVKEHRLLEHKKLILSPAYVHITKQSVDMYQNWCDEFNPQGYYSIGRYGQWTYCSMEDNIIQAKNLSKKIS